MDHRIKSRQPSTLLIERRTGHHLRASSSWVLEGEQRERDFYYYYYYYYLTRKEHEKKSEDEELGEN